ncbi:hypothetical protein SK128_004268 [Halocaridina rubra]|uniref:Uncharacterized protein n=1 Tax=Halocaridina rubra TaxID=373956 RepID=A0AAN8X1Q3_HALRR
MSSSALNTGMLEALVVSLSITSQNQRDSNSQPNSPSSAGGEPPPSHHNYIHARFQGVASHFTGHVDSHKISTSGGGASTGDDEGNLNDQLVPTEDSLRRHIIEEHIGRLLNDEGSQQQQQHMKQELETGEQRMQKSEGTPLDLSSLKWEDCTSPRHLHEEQRSPPTSVPTPPSFHDGKF